MNEVKCHFGYGFGAEVPFSVKGGESGEEAVVAAVAADGVVKARGLPWAAPRHCESVRASDVAGTIHEGVRVG